jgi:hypothetical protein
MTARWLGPLLGAWVLLAPLAGCGGGSPAAYAGVLKDKLAIEQEEIEVLESVRDEPSMKAAQERLKELDTRLNKVEVRFKALGPPAPEVQARLQDEFGTRTLYNRQTILEEIRRIRQLPCGPEFFERLSSALPH